MIEQAARVVEVEQGYAWVETERKTGCGACAQQKGCSASLFDKLLAVRRARVRALNILSAGVGDDVVIGVAEQAVLRGSFAVYAVPLLAMLVFALCAEWLAGRFTPGSELYTIAAAVMGFMAGQFWLRRHNARIADDPRYQPVVLRHLST
ncbi:MAG: SoxR reducing system RseC family protein [Gammaproteobacteria bacterium]|nr:SoxR reducing system RseC family protein [Gammaproteobacteria bacterium]